MNKHLVGDTTVLLGRSIRHIARSPDTIITTAIMPIALLLLFVYVLGGAIQTGSDSYVSYLLPGILIITIASGISYTAFRLFLDMQGGIFERFQQHAHPLGRETPVVVRIAVHGEEHHRAQHTHTARGEHPVKLAARRQHGA